MILIKLFIFDNAIKVILDVCKRLFIIIYFQTFWLVFFILSQPLCLFANNNLTISDSLGELAHNENNKSKAKALYKLSFYYVDKNVAKSFQYAKTYINLPDNILSEIKKITFLKKLAKDFASSKNFELSYNILRLADSLNNRVQETNFPQSSSARKSKKGISTSFYFLIISLIFLIVSGGYYWWNRKKEKEALRLTQKLIRNYEREFQFKQQKLEKQIDEKTANLLNKLKELKEKDALMKAGLKKAEEANYLKNAFIANMGFDIRTPLNSIIGFANILETELAIRENKEFYDYAANIEQSGFYLLKMLNSVIDLSSLETNTLELKIAPIKLDEAVKEVTAEYILTARDKGLIFKVKIAEDLPLVLADNEALKKVLSQIIDNAIQYTLEGFVTLSCEYDEKHDLARIEVKDTGIGINQKQMEVLRKSPGLLQNEAEKYSQGAGIGLKLAGKFVEIMNGRMDFVSTAGEGTTVIIQIPCSEKAEVVIERMAVEQASVVKSATTSLHEPSKLDFFVVEDDRMNRMIIEKILSKEGKVTMAVDGDNCIDIIEHETAANHYFQVMLFDINLPEPWDGVKLMKEIRKKYPKYRKIPFIAQTAYAMAGDKERFLKEGFDSYIAKPIDKNELISLVKQQLELFTSIK